MVAAAVVPSPIANVVTGKLGSRWRVELVDEFDEHVGKLGIVVFGLAADDLDRLSVAVCRLLFLAAGPSCTMPRRVPAVMHVGKAHEEITGGGCGLFELASLDEGDRNVGGQR